ncbi:MAG: YoaK family protein [Candidatus Sulfotelmatobacter sp.]
MNIQSDDVPVLKIEPRSKAAFRLAVFGARTLASLYGPVAFAFLGGYADASGYVVTGAFTGHITGAIVVAAIGAASRDWRNFILRLGGIAGFLISVAIAESLVEKFGQRLSRYVLTLLIAIELALFALGYLASSLRLNSAQALLVICLSLALGLQNGVWRRLGGAVALHTTFFTGLSMNLVATETDEKLLHSRGASNVSSVKLPVDLLLAFFLGATLGAAAALHFHVGAILGAVLLLVLMMTASAVRLETRCSADTR